MPFDPVRVHLPDGQEYGPVAWLEVVQWSEQGRIPLDATIIDHVSGERVLASTFAVFARNAKVHGVSGVSTLPAPRPPSSISITAVSPGASGHTGMAFMVFFQTYIGPFIRQMLEAHGFRLTEQGYQDVIVSLGNSTHQQLVSQQVVRVIEQWINDETKRQAAIEPIISTLRAMPADKVALIVNSATPSTEMLRVPHPGAASARATTTPTSAIASPVSSAVPATRTVQPTCLAVLPEMAWYPNPHEIHLGSVILYDDRLCFFSGGTAREEQPEIEGLDGGVIGKVTYLFGCLGALLYWGFQALRTPRARKIPPVQFLEQQYPDLYPSYRRMMAARWGPVSVEDGFTLTLRVSDVAVLESASGPILVKGKEHYQFFSKVGQANHNALIRAWHHRQLSRQASVTHYGVDLPVSIRPPVKLLQGIRDGQIMTSEESAYICAHSAYLSQLATVYLAMSNAEKEPLIAFWKNAPAPFAQALREAINTSL